MADPIEGTAHATHAAGKGGLSFLTQKVGPLPLGVWLAAGIVLVWYFSQQNKKSSTSTAGQQTDPAGNVGTIDPQTGYVYGSSEDQAGLAADDTTSSTGTSGQSATTGAQTYADNNAWGTAAINYLVGLGIDATTANQAVQQYLSSQVLTTAQQGDVNLAIQALGPPPSLPGPTSSNPTPVTGGSGTGGNTGTTGNPTLSNGHVVSVGATNAVVAWTGTNATKWQTKIVGPGKINGQTSTVTIPQATYSGLESGHDYTVTVTPIVNGKLSSVTGHVDFKTSGGSAATTAKK